VNYGNQQAASLENFTCLYARALTSVSLCFLIVPGDRHVK
jgi:hypothetical protein